MNIQWVISSDSEFKNLSKSSGIWAQGWWPQSPGSGREYTAEETQLCEHRASEEKLSRRCVIRTPVSWCWPLDVRSYPPPPPSEVLLLAAHVAGLSLVSLCQAQSRTSALAQGGGGEAPGTAPRVHFQQAQSLASDWPGPEDHPGLWSHWSRLARAAHNDVTALVSRDLASAMLDWITQSCADEWKSVVRIFEKSRENQKKLGQN